MNKLMKMATVVVGVGAMLSFAGCGKQNPLKNAARTARELNTIVTSSGLSFVAAPVPVEYVAALEEGKMDKDDAERAIANMDKIQSALPMYKRYISCMIEINKLGAKYYEEALKTYNYVYQNEVEKFFKMSAEEQKECVTTLEEGVSKIKAQSKK